MWTNAPASVGARVCVLDSPTSHSLSDKAFMWNMRWHACVRQSLRDEHTTLSCSTLQHQFFPFFSARTFDLRWKCDMNSKKRNRLRGTHCRSTHRVFRVPLEEIRRVGPTPRSNNQQTGLSPWWEGAHFSVYKIKASTNELLRPYKYFEIIIIVLCRICMCTEAQRFIESFDCTRCPLVSTMAFQKRNYWTWIILCTAGFVCSLMSGARFGVHFFLGSPDNSYFISTDFDRNQLLWPTCNQDLLAVASI